MKKTFLAIALAAVAFVGCQKEEEGMVTINLSGEKFVTNSNDKQAWYETANSVFFTNGDAVVLNGGNCPISLRDAGVFIARDINDEISASYSATLSVLAEYMHAPAIALYPASIFTPGTTFDGTSTDISDWTVTMKENQYMINPYEATNIIDELTNGGVANKPSWPMIALTPSLSDNVQLKNCVAILTPAVDYHAQWVAELISQNPIITETANAENLPIFKIDSIVFSSTTNILAGQGHIDLNTIQKGYPVLVMDETDDASYRIVCRAVDEYNADGKILPPTNRYVPVGHIPVAPYLNENGNIQANMYFTLTFIDETTETEHVYYCKYESSRVNVPIVRTDRTLLHFDCRGTGRVNQVTVSTTPLN